MLSNKEFENKDEFTGITFIDCSKHPLGKKWKCTLQNKSAKENYNINKLNSILFYGEEQTTGKVGWESSPSNPQESFDCIVTEKRRAIGSKHSLPIEKSLQCQFSSLPYSPRIIE